MGLDAALVKALALAVKVPNGVDALSVTDDNRLGTAPPPNALIGFSHSFRCQVLPNTVDFGPAGGKVSFQENKPGDTWTWPDGVTPGSTNPSTPGYKVDTEKTDLNIAYDTISSGADRSYDVALLAAKNFTYTIRVPEEYKDGAGKWVSFFATETHDKSYRGATLDGRGTFKGSNTLSGGWLGPWKSIP